MWGKGSRDRGTLNNNRHGSRSGQTGGRGSGGIRGKRTSKGCRGDCRRRGGRLYTRPVSRAVPTTGLGHPWIREGMGRAERFSYSGNLLWGMGNEMN